MVFTQKLHELTKEDIYELIRAKVPEGVRVEYKQSPYGGTESAKREFAEDIVSFANQEGGHILLGVKEIGGDPIAVTGIGEIDPDKEILRMSQMVRTNIEPRITCSIVKVACDEGTVIVIHVPKSTNAPYRSKLRESGYVIRTNNGKQPMSDAEIRSMILTGNKVGPSMTVIRDERLEMLRQGQGVFPLTSDHLLVLHIVPLAAIDSDPLMDVGALTRQLQGSLVPPFHHQRSGFSVLPNYEGASSTSNAFSDTPKESYVQLFKNGMIEAVEAQVLALGNVQNNSLPMDYEREVLELVDAYRHLLASLEVNGPYHVMLSILNVRGFVIQSNQFSVFSVLQVFKPIAQEDLLLDRVVIDDLEDDLEQKLRPVFNAVWQATGRVRSESYNENGQYVGRKWYRTGK